MKSTSIFKASILALIAAGLIAISPIQNTVFAKDTSKTEVVKKHKHKRKHKKNKKNTKTSSKTNKNGNKTGGNNPKDNKTGNNQNNVNKK
ncbi:MAG: hypothetical protein IT280_12715 [Ignavibacteria bacterium]|nr:hypothetical protein [Ignavibacteria bacterium]